MEIQSLISSLNSIPYFGKMVLPGLLQKHAPKVLERYYKWDEQNQKYYYYDPDYYYYDNYYDPYYYPQNEFSWENLDEGLPKYNPEEDLAGDDYWLDWIYYFRYIINIWFIAVPWTVLGLLCVVWNIYFNIDFNHWWANGNIWRIVSTIYILGSYIQSLLEAFEFPLFLRSFRVYRFLSVIVYVLYVTTFVILAFEWGDMLYIVEDKENYDFGTLYLNMVLGYNIVMHWSVVPVCLFSIFKEISMEFFQFLNNDAGTENDQVALGT